MIDRKSSDEERRCFRDDWRRLRARHRRSRVVPAARYDRPSIDLPTIRHLAVKL
jgi:hypothetical protein